MTNKIISLEERSQYDPAGAVVFDGDGDGTSGAALWLMHNTGDYLAITNQQKGNRALVDQFTQNVDPASLNGKRVAIFDIAAEDNMKGLERLASSGAQVDYVDHHTRDASRIPAGMNSYVEKDGRDNSTATISYKMAEAKGALATPQAKRKAAQLAVIGLANDGKESASQSFGADAISPEERADLIRYAKAINYGSSAGDLDSVAVLRGFMGEDPLSYLRSSEQVNGLVKKRADAIDSMGRRAQKLEDEHLVLYVLPTDNPEDRKLAEGVYSEFLNSAVAQDTGRIYAATMNLGDKWRVAARSRQQISALSVANRVASNYGKEAKGRETAAGFDAQSIDPQILYDQLRGAYEHETH